jgi:hypothetical protein
LNFKFQIKKEDYQKSLRGYFLYLLPLVLLISFFFSLIIAYSFASPKPDADFNLSVFIIALVISFGLLIFFFWGIKYLKSIRRLKRTETESADTVLNVEVLEKGILLQMINSDKKIQKTWTEIKNLIHRKEFTYLIFTDGTYIFLSHSSNSKELINEFSTYIEKHRSPFVSKISTQLKWWSFIPFIGLVFGLIFFIRGLSERNFKYLGIAFTSLMISIVGWLAFAFYWDYSGKTSQQNLYATQQSLNTIVKELAYYKVKNGAYPESLDSLKKQNQFLIFSEHNMGFNPFSKSESRDFYYQRQDSTYILLAPGPDAIPLTEDDILPDY